MIEIKDLYKYYYKKNEKFEALKGISFNIQKGKIFGLLGPNGAGKTTTLRILSTILKPTKGEILYEGKSIYDNEIEYKKRMAYISANTGIYNRLYPYEFIKIFGLMYGIDEYTIKKRFNKIVNTMNMKNILRTKCGKLSTGEKQKVLIAKVMITNPQILILDEPTNGLDVITSKNIIDFIRKEKEKEKLIIISTHILSEAEYLCDDIGIIHKGKLLYNGTLHELKKIYKNLPLESIFLNMVEDNIE